LPILAFQGKSHKADAGEELGGRKAMHVAVRLRDGDAVAALARLLQRQLLAGADAVVPVEVANPFPLAKEAARVASDLIAANVGAYYFIQAVEDDFDRAHVGGGRLARPAEAIAREKIVVATNVKV